MKALLQKLTPLQKRLLGAVVGAVVAWGGYQAYGLVSPMVTQLLPDSMHTSAPQYTADSREAKVEDIVAKVKAQLAK